MEGILRRTFFSKLLSRSHYELENLSQGKIGKEYRITAIKSEDSELESFLFSLGCYEGEVITLISILGETYVINIKDGRYSIDKELAIAIKVEAI